MDHKMLVDKERDQFELRCLYVFLGFITLLTIFLIVILISSMDAHAGEITEKQAVKCILGEARGESYKSMVAHAETIRNRGHLRGVYGCRAKITRDDGLFIRRRGIDTAARMAWLESKKTNLTRGATHWESTDFKKPSWAYKMIETAHIGKTRFYK